MLGEGLLLILFNMAETRRYKERETKKLVKKLTPKFLDTLKEACKCCGWDVDWVESSEFVEWCYKQARIKLPKGALTPYEYGSDEELERDKEFLD